MNLNVNSVSTNPIVFQKKGFSLRYLPEKCELKELPGNRCACCGEKMIHARHLNTMWDKISAPLSEALQIGRFANIKNNYPTIHSLLKVFSNKYPNESFDEIIQRDDNYHELIHAIASALPGRNLIEYKRGVHFAVKNLFYDITCKSRIITKPISSILENFMPIKKFLDKSGNDVYEELMSLAEKYPNEQIMPILKKKEIKENYSLRALQDVTDLAYQRDYHIEKVNSIISDKNPHLSDELKKARSEVNQIYQHGVDPQRVKYEIKMVYEKILEKYNLTCLSEKINSELENLPGTFFTKNTFLSYAKFKHTDTSIMYHIISPVVESEEHINALSAGGEQEVNNLIIMCRKCNQNRSNIPYDEFSKYHPEAIKNIPRQINLIGQNILNKKISSRLKDYPIKVSQVIYNASNGTINPDVQWYIERLLANEAQNECHNHLNLQPEILHNH